MQGTKRKVASKADPLIGRTVGVHYALERFLGEGAKGRVYLANHRTLHRTVVLMLLPREALADEAAVARFEEDSRALSALEHPNITAIHDFGVSDEFGPFFVVEHIAGVTLTEFLVAHGANALETFVPIAAQVLKALGAAHARGILHGDLKPANIFLIEHQGRANFVKICDLGLRGVFGDALE